MRMYSKGERVLRVEAIAHNTAELRCGKVIDKFPVMIERLAGRLEQFLELMRCIDVSHRVIRIASRVVELPDK